MMPPWDWQSHEKTSEEMNTMSVLNTTYPSSSPTSSATTPISDVCYTVNAEGNSFNVAALSSAMSANAFVFIALMVIFELSRGWMKRIFTPRVRARFIEEDRCPPNAPSNCLFGWFMVTWNATDEEVLKWVGLDGYMFCRFMNLCCRYSAFVSFFGMIVLVPVYTSQNESNPDWLRMTIGNIPPKDDKQSLLWVTTVFAYIFAVYFCYLFYEEYNNFVQKRVLYLENGDADTPLQAHYTLMIERLPTELQSVPTLTKFFEEVFPGQVHSVEIALMLRDLDTACSTREKVRNSLEKAIAYFKASGEKTRPTMWVKNSFYDKTNREKGHIDGITNNDNSTLNNNNNNSINSEDIVSDSNNEDSNHDVDKNNAKSHNSYTPDIEKSLSHLDPVADSCLATAFGCGIYDSIQHLTYKLRYHNLKVRALQKIYLDKMNRLDEENSQLKGHFETAISTGLGNLTNLTNLKAGSMPLPFAGNRKDTLSSSNEAESCEDVSATENSGDAGAMSSHSAHLKLEKLGTGVERVVTEGVGAVQIVTQGAWRGVVEGGRFIELVTSGAHYTTSSTAFVTLKSRVSHCAAEQMLLSHDHFETVITSAPSPNEIVWRNISIPYKQKRVRIIVADLVVLLGGLFWASIVVFIQSISNLKSISELKHFEWLSAYENGNFYKFLNEYLAVGILLILLNILPILFDLLARSYEGRKFESDIQSSVMKRFFFYQVVNVYCSVAGGSLFQCVNQIFSNPESILQILGQTFPSYSTYFASLVFLKTFTVLPLGMLRPWPFIQLLIFKSTCDKKKYTRRELRNGPFADEMCYYGWIYPSFLMVLMIMMIYSCIAPILSVFCMTFFWCAYIVYKYQLLFVNVTNYQSGGYMWDEVFSRSMISLIFAVFTLICYLGIHSSADTQAKPFPQNLTGAFWALLPLPFGLIGFWSYCYVELKRPASNLCLASARKLDQAFKVKSAIDPYNELEDDQDRLEQKQELSLAQSSPLADTASGSPNIIFSSDMFLQPSLVVQDLVPEAYRAKGKSSGLQRLSTISIDSSIEEGKGGEVLGSSIISPMGVSNKRDLSVDACDVSDVKNNGSESRSSFALRDSDRAAGIHRTSHFSKLPGGGSIRIRGIGLGKEILTSDMFNSPYGTPTDRGTTLMGQLIRPDIDTEDDINDLLGNEESDGQ